MSKSPVKYLSAETPEGSAIDAEILVRKAPDDEEEEEDEEEDDGDKQDDKNENGDEGYSE